MSKTYTITPSINAGRRDSLADYWTNFMQGDNGGLVVGYSKYGYTSNQYRAVNFLLSDSDKAQFSGKTITSIVLRIKVSSGTIGSVNYAYRVRYKYNNVATTTSSSDAWASGNAEGTAYSDTDIATWSNGQSSGTTTIDTNTVHDFDLGTTLPANGYVLAGTRSMVAYMILAEASIIVTTNETEKTLIYNANGGMNPPATQTGWSNPNASYTFTVSSSQPTRTGFEFVNWNTASDGSGTSKTGGQTIAVSSSTTLYAQWSALKSTLNTISTGTIGSTVSVSWTAKGSFQHRLKFTLGASTTSEVTISAGTNSYTFTIPSSWLNELPTTTSGTATATLTTLVDGSSIGTDSKSFTVNVGSSVVPSIGTVTATKVNINPTVSAWDIYLQSYSQVQITANSLTAGTGATLASVRFTGQNLDYTIATPSTSANATSNTITASGSLTYTVTLTDSRGRTATKTATISVTAYQPPTVTFFYGWRCDADGTVNPITGESLEAQVRFTYTQVGTNAVTNSLTYKKTTESSWSTAGTNVASNSITIFATNTADVASTYNVQFYIVDSLGASSTMNITISSVAGIAFGLKNDRARFGGAVRQAGLEVDWTTYFDENVIVKSDNPYPVRITDGNGEKAYEFINYNGVGQFSVYNAGTERNYIGDGRFSTYNTSGTEVDRISQGGSFFGSNVNHTGALTVNNKPVVLSVNNVNADANGNVNIAGASAKASLSSAGWYRVFEFAPTSGYKSYDITGVIGAIIKFYVTRRFHWNGSETHEITLSFVTNNIKWTQETSNAYVYGIDKIRLMTNTNTSKAFVDIHYTLTQENQTAVNYDIYCPLDPNGVDYHTQFTSKNLSAVADAPSGETVLSTYTFTANTEIPITWFTPTTGSSYTPFGGCWYMRKGNLCHVHVGMSGLTANTLATIYTLPSGMIPTSGVVALGIGYATLADDISRVWVWADGVVQVMSTSDYADIDIEYLI